MATSGESMTYEYEYGPPPKTPPPAYDESGRRSSKNAWPLADSVWTTPGNGAVDEKVCNEKDPKQLGPAVELGYSTPMRSIKSYQEVKGAPKNKSCCMCTLIVLVVMMSLVIMGLVIGLAVGVTQLKKYQHNGDDTDNNLCAGRTCSFNGYCQQVSIMNIGYAWCQCNAGYTGLNCEQYIVGSSCAYSCKYGTCLPPPSSSPISMPADSPASAPGASQGGPSYGGPGAPMPGSGSPNGFMPTKPSTTPATTTTGSFLNWFYNPTPTPSDSLQCVCWPGYQGPNCDQSQADPCAGVTCNYQGKCVSGTNNPYPSASPLPNPAYPADYNGGNGAGSPHAPPPPPAQPNSPNGPANTDPNVNIQMPYHAPYPSPMSTTPPQSATNYQCVCNSGFQGKDCEMASSPASSTPIPLYASGSCSSFPCQHKGMCIDMSDVSIDISPMYMCFCQPDYTGINCEINTMADGGSYSNGNPPPLPPY